MMGFSWKHHFDQQEARLLQRLTSLARVNPDFQVAHPELVKELSSKMIVNKIETKRYIQKKLKKSRKYSEVPKPSVIIKRLNRVV